MLTKSLYLQRCHHVFITTDVIWWMLNTYFLVVPNLCFFILRLKGLQNWTRLGQGKVRPLTDLLAKIHLHLFFLIFQYHLFWKKKNRTWMKENPLLELTYSKSIIWANLWRFWPVLKRGVIKWRRLYNTGFKLVLV